jgi:probable metal-binding protein
MSTSIHGHEVLKMMLATGKPYTRETLHADILTTFGSDARFHTCSAESMTADELITFLEARGKFADCGEGFNTEPTRICSG